MKKLSILLSFIFLLIVATPLLSACNEINYNKYKSYSFDDSKGQFLSSSDNIVINESKTKITLKASAFSNTFDCEINDGVIKIKGEEKFYYSQYFVAPIEALYGQVQIDEQSIIGGQGTINKTALQFNGGEILDKGVVKGYYEQNNNYVIINYNGEKREYLALKKDNAEENGIVYLFDSFYSNIKVLSKEVDNTGFSIENNILTNVSDGKINVIPNVSGYQISNLTITVVDNGGFVIYLGENGVYEIRPSSRTPKDKVKLKIKADDIEKIIELTPILFEFDDSLLVVRYVGDTVDFSNNMFFICDNFEFNKVLYSVSIIEGENVASLNNKILTFNKIGQVKLQLKASYTINGNNFQVVDEVLIKSIENVVQESA